MTPIEFNKVVEDQLTRIQRVLVKKENEYSLGTDRLSVFKHGAGITEENEFQEE